MVLTGFWTPAIAREFTRQLDMAVATMRQAELPARSLIDIRDLSLLSVTLTPVFRSFVEDQSRICDRIALISSSMLQRLQAKRLIDGTSRFQLFSTIDDAEDWLGEALGADVAMTG